jgi:hypothetical protein
MTQEFMHVIEEFELVIDLDSIINQLHIEIL